MITCTNLDAAFDKIDKWLADTEDKVERIAIGLLYFGLDVAATRSPQYSGDFVANWRVSAKVIDTTFQSGIFPGMEFPIPEGTAPFQRGDAPAILHAIRESTGKLTNFRLGDKLWLANSAKHEDLLEETYAWKIENNFIKFRPPNFGGDGPLRQVKEAISTNYSRIGRHNMRTLL